MNVPFTWYKNFGRSFLARLTDGRQTDGRKSGANTALHSMQRGKNVRL